jgi:asparaginyl-tRNA synthetase
MVPHMTKATGSCENFMTVFELDYFGKRVYLSQTGQLYLEVLTPFLKKVWCVIHSFRAEPDVDSRHLTEFPLIELEFEGDFEQLTRHIEGTIYSMISQTEKERREELELFGIDKKHLYKFKPPYKRISYTEVIEILQNNGIEINWGDDIKSLHEKMISEFLDFEPFFLTHWPTPIKFFDMKTNEENPKTVNSCDLILPFSGEAVGGAEREHKYETLKKKLEESMMLKLLAERGGNVKDFEWFLDFYKKHDVNLHSGFGVGFNRVTQSLLKCDDIRSCTVFPLNRESIL